MTIDFTCRKCDTSFELDAADLADGTEKLICPNCDAKASTSMVDDFTAALSEFRTQINTLNKKFGVNLAVESEDLESSEDDDEDEDEEEDGDEDELDFDEDDEDVEEDEGFDEDQDR